MKEENIRSQCYGTRRVITLLNMVFSMHRLLCQGSCSCFTPLCRSKHGIVQTPVLVCCRNGPVPLVRAWGYSLARIDRVGKMRFDQQSLH
jgi:hypothetical protein